MNVSGLVAKYFTCGGKSQNAASLVDGSTLKLMTPILPMGT